MTMQELYEQIDGNYAELMGRLLSENLAKTALTMFLDDRNCANLIAAWRSGDEKAVFEAAHAAKSMCLNLSLTKLGGLASKITEATRKGNEELRASTDVDALVTEFEAEYEKVCAAVKAYLS